MSFAAYRPEFSPRLDTNVVKLSAPPEQALQDPIAANSWFSEAVDAAGELIYEARPGMPRHADNDRQILALALSAKPVYKGFLLSVLAGAGGRLVHLSYDRNLSSVSAILLSRLVSLLKPEACEKGNFLVKSSNAMLAQEMGKTERTIRRLMSELQEAGFIYRHFTTGPVGLSRKCIDLGPLVCRLPELQDGMAERALYRAEARADRSRCATLSEVKDRNISGREDTIDPLDTQDFKYLSVPVIAQEKDGSQSGVGKVLPEDNSTASIRSTDQLPVPPPPSIIVSNSPSLRAYLCNSPDSRSEVFEAAYRLAMNWGLNRRSWQSLCSHLGREWTTVCIATVAELPSSRFNQGLDDDLGSRRARYLAGIARKLATGEDVDITASWRRLVARRGANLKASALARRLC